MVLSLLVTFCKFPCNCVKDINVLLWRNRNLHSNSISTYLLDVKSVFAFNLFESESKAHFLNNTNSTGYNRKRLIQTDFSKTRLLITTANEATSP